MKTTFKKTFKNTLAVLVATGLMSTSAWAGGRDKLDEFFTQINTMQSAFTQQVIDDKGALRQSSSGNVYLSRPGKFRWEYAAPDKHEIVADGKNVWIYDVELDQVTVKPMTQALSAAPIGMLTQKQSVDKQFNVQEISRWQQAGVVSVNPEEKRFGFHHNGLGR